jgi:Zn-dependent M28 family amino/carboxypeptidase
MKAAFATIARKGIHMNRNLTPDERHLLISQIGARQIGADIRRYAALHSRHAEHAANREAVDMLVADLERISNGRLEISTPDFELDGLVLYNVEGKLAADGLDGIVIVSAHMDSTADGGFPYRPALDPAPGADDDASGVAGVLAAARAVLKLAALPDTPRREIRFVFFNAEEKKQRGSRAYAAAAKDADENIRGVFQLDMIGHDDDGYPAFQLHASYSRSGAVQAESLKLAMTLACLSAELSLDLVPQLHVFHPDPDYEEPGQGFSDHTSFHDAGYPACLVSEDFHDGPRSDPPKDPNPFHHLRGDTIDLINTAYAADITRAATAAAWHLATR